MRIALFGAGRIGQLHGGHLAEIEGIDEIVVNDVDPGRAAALAASISGRVADEPAAALDGVDAAIVAASTSAHATLTRMAADRGIPVFCEKPLAFDLDETVDLVAHIERLGATVQVGFQRRFDPAYVEARRMVEAGELGTVYLVRLIAHDHEPPPDAYIPMSGGLFRDSSIHDFDSLRWMTGVEVDEVYADGSVRGFPVFAEHGDIDTGAVILHLADGTLGVLSQTRHDPRGYDIRMEIVGSLDSIAMGTGPRTPLHSVEPDATAPGPAYSDWEARFEPAYRAEMAAFLRLVRGEIASPCLARDALEAMRISIAAGRSRAEHRPIRLADVAGM